VSLTQTFNSCLISEAAMLKYARNGSAERMTVKPDLYEISAMMREFETTS
jgi:hypothetical protein